MHCRTWPSLIAVALAVTAAVASAPVGVRTHRLVRVYDWTNGYPWSYTGTIEQDRRGFLWVSATSGLYRFDGTRATRVADPLGLAPGSTAAGRVIAWTTSKRTYEATASGLTLLNEEVGMPEVSHVFVAVASDGTPWRVRKTVLQRLDSEGNWVSVIVPTAPEDPVRGVSPGRQGRVYVTSRSFVWVVEQDGTVRRVAPVEYGLSVLERTDGTVVVGANHHRDTIMTRLFDVTGGVARLVYEERGARLISMAERGDKIWLSMDTALQSLGPGFAAMDRVPPPVSAAGALVVDREGSLWVATFRGLVQIPEPDVFTVQAKRGSVTRDIARTAHGVWGTFWGELLFVSADESGLDVTQETVPHYSVLCADGAGRVWTGVGKILRLDSGGKTELFDSRWGPESCGTGAHGRRWITSSRTDLWTVSPADALPHSVPILLDTDGISFAAETEDGSLWLASGPRMCAARSDAVLHGKETWRCEDIPDGGDVFDFESTPSGDIWALTSSPGSIRRRAGGRWEVLPGSTGEVDAWTSITPSPSGGFWLSGQGVLVRAAERTDLPAGWEILERPTVSNGMLSLNVVAVVEDADGTLWLGTDTGIQRIPADIRRRRPDPPSVELVEGWANGVPLDATSPVRLPYGRNRLEARFAALTYRDPTAVRYRVRLHDDDPWPAAGPAGHFTFVDLPPGDYDLQVVASLDGSRWSESAARVAFRVLRPWYVRPWFWGSAMIGVMLAGHLGYRLRLRRRLAMERQRTRIAMDLHDEVGSGLGTITVLAGIAGRPNLPDERRNDAASRIAAVSQELARSLGDIVWSLRASSGSLDALWDQLLERARPLFASGVPRVSFEAPDPVPDDQLALVVRRNLHLVAYEALHNAARHSGASNVVLRLARDVEGWRLEVEDDGRGIPAGQQPPSVRRGLGIEAMRARVAELNGSIAWERGAAGGTRVVVRFRTGRE
jgi:signal transduction histidine kinase/ligand-binding sensor domain-containing protein